MPFAIIPPVTPPIPRFTPSSGALTGPADGDPLLATSVNEPFAQLADRTTLAFTGLYGVYGSRLVASCNDGANILLNNQAAVRSSTGVLTGNLGSPISIAGVLGSAPVADTWYYLYGQDLVGILTPVISTDPPEATLKYRTGNADQVFITMFYTNGTADVYPFVHYEGSYQYLTEINSLSAGVSGVFVPVALAEVPPFAVIATIKFLVTTTGTTTELNYSYPLGLAATRAIFTDPSPDGVKTSSVYLVDNVPIDGQNGFDYRIALGSGSAYAWLTGFMI